MVPVDGCVTNGPPASGAGSLKATSGVSLGLPAVFLFGGLQRTDKTQRIPLSHGDVLVWGGEDRLRFHGVLPIKPGVHPRLGERRINLTLRKAGG